MEGLSSLHRRVVSIDLHRMLQLVTVLIEQPDGSMSKHSREFGGFKRDCRALAAWPALSAQKYPPHWIKQLKAIGKGPAANALAVKAAA